MRTFTDEDYAIVRARARDLCQGRWLHELDEAYADGLEAMTRAAHTYDPSLGPWPRYLRNTVQKRIVDARRRAHGRTIKPSEASRQYADAEDMGYRRGLSFTPLLERHVVPVEDEVDVALTATVVRSAVARLSPVEQEIAWASVGCETQRALAERLGVTESAVSHRRHFVHARLRAMLRDVA